jgi:hypothetical protein
VHLSLASNSPLRALDRYFQLPRTSTLNNVAIVKIRVRIAVKRCSRQKHAICMKLCLGFIERHQQARDLWTDNVEAKTTDIARTGEQLKCSLRSMIAGREIVGPTISGKVKDHSSTDDGLVGDWSVHYWRRCRRTSRRLRTAVGRSTHRSRGPVGGPSTRLVCALAGGEL